MCGTTRFHLSRPLPRTSRDLTCLFLLASGLLGAQDRAGADSQPSKEQQTVRAAATEHPPAPPLPPAEAGTQERRTGVLPANEARILLLLRSRQILAGIQSEEMLGFFAEANPEFLAELDGKCRDDMGAAQEQLRWMARRFRDLERLRIRSPRDYEREVRIERLEGRSRSLGKTVRALTEPEAEQTRRGRVATSDVDPAKTKRALKAVLQDAFTVVQQGQLIEVNRLEAELKELRRLLAEREANRQTILERRFLELTGQTTSFETTP